MAKYKISVSFDEKNFFWVVIDREKFIRDPTKEDLIGATIKSYNKTNVCPICREENKITDKSILYPGNARHEKDKNGKETGEWVCKAHGLKHYHRYDPNSYDNMIKSMRDCRMDNQDPNSSNAKGDNSLILWLRIERKNKRGLIEYFGVKQML